MATDDTHPDEQQQEPQELSTRDASSDASARRSLESQSGVAWLIHWCARVEVNARRRARV